ncbi:hypothetical protein BX600DRAFT_471266 [Xylariales sp. PMI_506]|nr:hypothetical protein BX600DRAFT_471266 [Xylariales sp. PMI_506]
MILDACQVWDTISHVNDSGDAVGRITTLLDPSPLMLGGLHLTMSRHFDMDELFSHLATNNGNGGKTEAYMNRAFEQTELRQRSFFFVFKYYTVVSDGFTPAPWQRYSNRSSDPRSTDQIDICECSSILALSLEGRAITREMRHKKRGAQAARVYDSFAPWQLLNIKFFPDDIEVMHGETERMQFYNGPYAFLDSLTMEYRNAIQRNMNLHDKITKLITPPTDFIFDSRMRDKLLFEDRDLTYSRRYFWAYNTLRVINDGIVSMINAYTKTFTDEFWHGRHPTMFQFPPADTPEYQMYLEKLESLRRELDEVVSVLQLVRERNENTREVIKSLRDQLFAGVSVIQSRRAIEQGNNIKMLTSISLVFLPLTFVTSVWSMTGFPLEVESWQFPTAMVLACVPFILFILILQTTIGLKMFRCLFDGVNAVFMLAGRKIGGSLPDSCVPADEGLRGSLAEVIVSGTDTSNGEETLEDNDKALAPVRNRRFPVKRRVPLKRRVRPHGCGTKKIATKTMESPGWSTWSRPRWRPADRQSDSLV